MSRKVDIIKEVVSIYDLFDLTDPAVEYETKEVPTQISCPFHGDDARKSARVYPDTNSMRCFFCSKSWDVIWYWAQINDWWLDNERLDFWRAVNDLSSKYNIDSAIPKWEENFYKLKINNISDYDQYSLQDRQRLKEFYCWELAKSLHKLDKEDRVQNRDKVLAAWYDFDQLDLTVNGWKASLTDWYESAKLAV